MFKKVLFRGTVLIGSLVATVTMLDKIEEAGKKYKKTKAEKKNSNKKVKRIVPEEKIVDAIYRDII